jgi:type VI secretion system secreted protein Hcp
MAGSESPLKRRKNMNVLIMDMGDDVNGVSRLSGYEGKIELLGFSHAVVMQMTGEVSGAERTSGRPSHQDFTITKYLDATSPMLNQACCEGKVFPKIDVIIGTNENGKVSEMMRYTIKGVLISAVSGGGSGGDRLLETVTLNYNHITWKFTLKESGTSLQWVFEGKWDLAKNRAV